MIKECKMAIALSRRMAIFAAILLVSSILCSAAPVEQNAVLIDGELKEEKGQQEHREEHQPHHVQINGGSGGDVGLGSLVNSLLASLLQQTLYNRMENLLLDSGNASSGGGSSSEASSTQSISTGNGEKRRIVDSAVRNYHRQDYKDNGPSPAEFTKLAGESDEIMSAILHPSIKRTHF